MQNDKRVVVDFRKEGSSSQILPRPPLLTSLHSGWKGLFVESHVQPAMIRVSTFCQCIA